MSTLVLELAQNGPVHWAHVIPYINISIVGFISESVGFYMLISKSTIEQSFDDGISLRKCYFWALF